MRKWASFILLTTLCLGLVACGATPTPAPPLPTNTPVLATDVHIPNSAQLAASSAGPTPLQTPEAADVMGMTIWTCRRCDGCHGVFAQGGPDAPTLAGLNYPVEEELARMRSQAETIPEHGPDHISDEVFAKLYEWLKMGCVRDECYH